MSDLIRSMEILALCTRRADVHGHVRVSITFDNERDLALFRAECQRQLNINLVPWHRGPFDISSFTIAGIEVRII